MNYAIIAAGEGSRLVQEGVPEPKPFVRINGERMIDRLIRIFLNNKAQSITIIVNEQMTQVSSYLQGVTLPVALQVIVCSTPSSMHSFYELSKVMPSGKFCLTTVDTIFKESDFARYIDYFENDSLHDGVFAVTDFIEDESPLYVDVDSADHFTIRQFRDDCYDGGRFISGGIYGLTDRVFPILKDAVVSNQSRMRNFQRRLLAEKLMIQAFPFEKIIDVDHLSDIAVAESFLSM